MSSGGEETSQPAQAATNKHAPAKRRKVRRASPAKRRAHRQRVLALAQTYSAGVIAEMLGFTRGKVSGIIDRAKPGYRQPRRHTEPRKLRGRKPVGTYKHKVRFTRWLPPEGGVFQQARKP